MTMPTFDLEVKACSKEGFHRPHTWWSRFLMKYFKCPGV